MKRLLFSILFIIGFAPSGHAQSPSASGGPKTRLIVGFWSDFAPQQREQLVKGLGLKVVESIEPLGIDVVEAPKSSAGAKAVQLKATPGVQAVEEDVYRNWLLIDASPNLSATPLVTPGFKDIVAAMPAAVPPDVPVQTGEFPWGVLRVKANQAWNKNDGRTMGAGVRVGVIDTGIDCGHKDLVCDDREGVNEVDPKALPMDDNGHGTHVSGTIAAKWDGQPVVPGEKPASRVVGVAPLAHLVPVKVLNGKGEGRLSDVIKGILWCADRKKHHIDVVNMSLGGPTPSFFLQLAVQWAHRNGVTIVAAAGNEGPGENTVGFPGGYPAVIAVAASTRKPLDQIAKFSSRGQQVKFIAPGVDVVSTVPGGKYATHAGTSMATPHMTGLAALAIAEGASTPDEVLAALRAASTKLNGLSDSEQGYGMPDATRIPHRLNFRP